MMLHQIVPASISRRRLFSTLPIGAAACMGCTASALCSQVPAPAQNHWAEKADMTWEQIFGFTYGFNFIPAMKGLGQRIGNDKLYAILRETKDERIRSKRPMEGHTLRAWAEGFKQNKGIFKHALVAEVVEDTEHAFEIRITQCLWAKTFREHDAAELGYSVCCHGDFADASAYNPKMKLVRSKTLMQGQDCCNHRWVVEA